MPFVIGPAERDVWLRHMNAATEAMRSAGKVTSDDARELSEYFLMAARSLVNSP